MKRKKLRYNKIGDIGRLVNLEVFDYGNRITKLKFVPIKIAFKELEFLCKQKLQEVNYNGRKSNSRKHSN